MSSSCMKYTTVTRTYKLGLTHICNRQEVQTTSTVEHSLTHHLPKKCLSAILQTTHQSHHSLRDLRSFNLIPPTKAQKRKQTKTKARQVVKITISTLQDLKVTSCSTSNLKSKCGVKESSVKPKTTSSLQTHHFQTSKTTVNN
jgi:hypothetical protein